MKEQGEACCTLDHVCRRGCVPPTSSHRPAVGIGTGNNRKIAFAHLPTKPPQTQASQNCIRYSDSSYDSFDWREVCGARGDGRRNERKTALSLRFLRVQHKFEFRFIDLFLVFSFPPTHPAIDIAYRIDCFILLLFSLRDLIVILCKRSGGERRLAGLPDD